MKSFNALLYGLGLGCQVGKAKLGHRTAQAEHENLLEHATVRREVLGCVQDAIRKTLESFAVFAGEARLPRVELDLWVESDELCFKGRMGFREGCFGVYVLVKGPPGRNVRTRRREIRLAKRRSRWLSVSIFELASAMKLRINVMQWCRLRDEMRGADLKAES